MLKACISEWLLALFTTRERAAAIVGDFLEVHLGPAGFWLAVLRTAWALSWRFGLGFLLAVAGEFFCFVVLGAWAATPPHGMDRMAVFSGWSNGLLTASALFAFVRFGPSDAITRLSAALAFLAGLDLFFWWMPFLRPVIGTIAVLVVLLCCLSHRGRAAFLRLLVATVAAAAPLLAMLYLGSRLRNVPVLLVTVLVLGFLVSSGIVAAVLGRHQKGCSQLA